MAMCQEILSLNGIAVLPISWYCTLTIFVCLAFCFISVGWLNVCIADLIPWLLIKAVV